MAPPPRKKKNKKKNCPLFHCAGRGQREELRPILRQEISPRLEKSAKHLQHQKKTHFLKVLHQDHVAEELQDLSKT